MLIDNNKYTDIIESSIPTALPVNSIGAFKFQFNSSSQII